MELKRYLQVMLKGWWLILPAILISVSSAWLVTYSQTPIYRSTATFVVSPSSSFSTLNETLRGLDSLSKRDGIMSTYVEIATSSTVLNAACQDMGLAEDQLEHLAVSSELVPLTNIIKITAESDDPLIAKTCADTVGQETIAYVKNLYEIYDMKPLDPAYVPQSPAKPQKAHNLILATLLGSVVGVGSAFLLHYLRSPGETMASVTIIDSSTGLYNRHYFLQRLGEEMSRARRHRHPLSVALVNVERLDAIPDMRLPRLRNEALRRVGLLLKKHLREEDLVARFEGDTFAILFPDTPGLDAEQMLQELQTRVEWSIFELEENGVKLNLTATSGVVAYDFNGTSLDEMLVKAERTLQQARDDGYGKVHLLKDDEEIENTPGQADDG
jgi:diguanylate cyclase (GGDEF)-like protein